MTVKISTARTPETKKVTFRVQKKKNSRSSHRENELTAIESTRWQEIVNLKIDFEEAIYTRIFVLAYI